MINTVTSNWIFNSFDAVRFLTVSSIFHVNSITRSNILFALISLCQEHKVVFAHKTNINYTYPINTL